MYMPCQLGGVNGIVWGSEKIGDEDDGRATCGLRHVFHVHIGGNAVS